MTHYCSLLGSLPGPESTVTFRFEVLTFQNHQQGKCHFQVNNIHENAIQLDRIIQREVLKRGGCYKTSFIFFYIRFIQLKILKPRN